MIAENLRYHAAHGVDCFLVTDNGSVALTDPDEDLDYPLVLRTMPPKAACALEGLERVFPGNHPVRHAHSRVRISQRIVIHHQPFRPSRNSRTA